MSSVRFIFDTNTLISALLFEDSTPGRALVRALQLGEILLSQATLEELAEVLQREKFDRYVTSSEREEFLEALLNVRSLSKRLKKYVCAVIPGTTSFWSWLSAERLTVSSAVITSYHSTLSVM